MSTRLLLFDLDGTLLRSDKTISQTTLKSLRKCREKGILIGVCTSRGEQNALSFIEELQPDVLITSGGALVKYNGEYIYRAEFSKEETRRMIAIAREVCGNDCEITIDTIDSHYWNYRIDPKKQDSSWGDSIYTDFTEFEESSLKMCVEIFEDSQARRLQELLDGCDCIRFSDGNWYKFTKKTATKENAILEICSVCGIKAEEIIAFGDDYADIGMIELCGKGIAMGNAVNEVKEKADLVIGSNDEDGIAEYLETNMTEKNLTGARRFQIIKIGSLILLAICFLCTVDLGINYANALLVEDHDGIVVTGILSRLIYGDHGWSLPKFFMTFRNTLLVTTIMVIENIILQCISIAKKL